MKNGLANLLLFLAVVSASGLVYMTTTNFISVAEATSETAVVKDVQVTRESDPPIEMPQGLFTRVEQAFGADAAEFVASLTPRERVSVWSLVDNSQRSLAVRRLSARFGVERAIPFLLNLEPGFAARNLQDIEEEDALDVIVEHALKLDPYELEFLTVYPEFTRIYMTVPIACRTYLESTPQADNLLAAWALCSAAETSEDIESALVWAQERGSRMQLIEQMCAEPVDDDQFSVLVALLRRVRDDEVADLLQQEPYARCIIMLCAASVAVTSFGLEEDDRLWVARQVLLRPDEGMLLTVLLNHYAECDRMNRSVGVASQLADKALVAYRSMGPLALWSCWYYRHNGDFQTILERDNPIATAMVTTQLGVSEDGDVVSYDDADAELAKILDRGDLYLSDFELNEDGLPAEKLSVTVRELVPGGDAYQLVKIVVNGKSPDWYEIGFGVLDGAFLVIDAVVIVGTLGLATPGAVATHAAVRGAIKGVVRWVAKRIPSIVRGLAKLGKNAAKLLRLVSSRWRAIGKVIAPPGSLARKALDTKTVVLNWVRSSPSRQLVATLASDVAVNVALREGLSQYNSFRNRGRPSSPLSWALEREVPVNREIVRSELHRYLASHLSGRGDDK